MHRVKLLFFATLRDRAGARSMELEIPPDLTVQGLKMINDDVPLGTPASKALYAELKSDPRIQATMASAQDGAPMPNNPEMGRFWSSMVSALGNIMDGRQSPKEALDGAAKRITAK